MSGVLSVGEVPRIALLDAICLLTGEISLSSIPEIELSEMMVDSECEAVFNLFMKSNIKLGGIICPCDTIDSPRLYDKVDDMIFLKHGA